MENLEILEQVFNVQHSFMRLEVGGGFLVSIFGNLKALRLCPTGCEDSEAALLYDKKTARLSVVFAVIKSLILKVLQKSKKISQELVPNKFLFRFLWLRCYEQAESGRQRARAFQTMAAKN